MSHNIWDFSDPPLCCSILQTKIGANINGEKVENASEEEESDEVDSEEEEQQQQAEEPVASVHQASPTSDPVSQVGT